MLNQKRWWPNPNRRASGAGLLARWYPAGGSHAKILNGSITLLIGSVVVSLANFGYNIGVARLLGPSDFSHAAAAVTILMLISAITLAFQLVGTKLIAKADSVERKAGIFQHLMKRAWIVGIGLGVFMLVANSVLTAYLRFSTPWIVILLSIGLTIYVPLGVKRGGLQGTCRFRALAWNMGAETVIKFVAAIVLIEMGFGVLGAVAAISGSVIVAFLLPDSAKELRGPAAAGVPTPVGEARQAIVFFVGQVIISNIDILMVKHFFPPAEAGLYAAIALVGRLLYFASWSVVSAMFPGLGRNYRGETIGFPAGDSVAAGHRHVGGVRAVAGHVSEAGIPGAVRRALPQRCGRVERVVEHECSRDRRLRHRRGADYVRDVTPHCQHRVVAAGGERADRSGRDEVSRNAVGGDCRPAGLEGHFVAGCRLTFCQGVADRRWEIS